MATLVEYHYNRLDATTRTDWDRHDLVGYLAMDPEDALRVMLPKYHITTFRNTNIPSIDDQVDHVLRLSPIPSGIGLVGTIQMLESESDKFGLCQRSELISASYGQNLAQKIKALCEDEQMQPFSHDEANHYALVLDILGHPISAEELITMSTPEGLYDPTASNTHHHGATIPGFPGPLIG